MEQFNNIVGYKIKAKLHAYISSSFTKDQIKNTSGQICDQYTNSNDRDKKPQERLSNCGQTSKSHHETLKKTKNLQKF